VTAASRASHPISNLSVAAAAAAAASAAAAAARNLLSLSATPMSPQL